MSGIYIPTGALLSHIRQNASSNKGSIPISVDTIAPITYKTKGEKAKMQSLESVLNREKLSKEKFEMGILNFRLIRLKVDSQIVAKQMSDWYKENDLLASEQEISDFVNKAIHEQEELLKESSMGEFSPSGNYISVRQTKSPGRNRPRKKISKNKVSQFLKDLNALYKNELNKRWTSMTSVVNGTPDTAYFVPVETEVIYNTKEGIPLGFSYDSTTKAFRVTYTPTGDPMFSYIYDNALDAVKARVVHMKMINWALAPKDIASMYQEWYGTPLGYNRVFKILHCKIFDEDPPYFMEVKGIFDAEKFYPDWRDQRAARNTLLTSIGGLGGATKNSDWTDKVTKGLIKGQNSNYMSLKEGYLTTYKTVNTLGKEVTMSYPGSGTPFSLDNVNDSSLPKRGRLVFKKPQWLKDLKDIESEF